MRELFGDWGFSDGLGEIVSVQSVLILRGRFPAAYKESLRRQDLDTTPSVSFLVQENKKTERKKAVITVK